MTSTALKLRNHVAQFVTTLFAQLDAHAIPYAVLRKYHTLPEEIGYDLDLLIVPQTRRFTALPPNLIQRVCATTEWELLRVNRRHSCFKYQFVRTNTMGQVEIIRVDAIMVLAWRGIRYADEMAMLQNRVRYNGFWVAGPAGEAAVTLLKDLFSRAHIKPANYERLQELVATNPDEFERIIKPYCGSAIAATIRTRVEAGQWHMLTAEAVTLKDVFRKYAWRHHPLRTLYDMATVARFYLTDALLTPPGLMVCLIGPDGSGKTTTAKALRDSIGELFARTRYYHGQLGIFPRLSRLLGRSTTEDEDSQQDPLATQASQPVETQADHVHPRWRSSLYAVYYGLEYILGHVVLRRQMMQNTLVLFDRYFYDFYIQSMHQRIPGWLLRLLSLAVPKPDLLVWLKSDAEVIHERKPELTLAELRRQLAACHALMDKAQNGSIIRTDDSVERAIQELDAVVVRTIQKKLPKQYRSPNSP